MSGRFRITLADGTDLYGPTENAQAAMAALDRKGIKFTDASEAPDVEGDVKVGEPEAIKPGPVQLDEVKVEGKAPGVLERLLGAVGRGRQAAGSNPVDDIDPRAAGVAGETAYDMTLAANRGLTHGLSSKLLGDDEAQAAARARSPRAYAATEQVARIPGDIGAAAIAGPWAAPAVGAVDGFADSRGDVLQQLLATGRGGALGAGMGMAGAGLAKAGGFVSDALGGAARKARAAAVGATGGDMKKLAESRGLDYVEGELGDMPEQLGVTNRLMPQSPSQYADRLGARATQANDQITQAVSDAESQGLDRGFVSKQPIDAALLRAQGAASRGPLGDRQRAANAFGDVRQSLADQNVETPTQLRDLKSTYDSAAYPNQLHGSSESFMGQAHKTAADAARQQLRGVMDYSLPETNEAFTQGNADYGRAKVLEELARNRAATQYAGGGLAGNIGAGAIGAGLGTAIGGGGTGAVAGAAFGMARPAYRAAQEYGPDLGANLARLGQQATGPGVGQTMAHPGSTDMLQQFVGGRAQQQDSDPGEAAQRATSEGRGHELTDVVEKLTYSDPQQLGPYAQQFQQALDDENGSRVDALLSKLVQSDPQFRLQVLPRLQQMTRGDR